MSFPAALSNALDGVTEIVAAHLNNLEAKVGIDGSGVPTSLDYLLKHANSIEPGHKHSKLWAADGSPQAVTVDAAGNVGLGTTSPGAKLEVYENSTSGYAVYINNIAGTSGGTSGRGLFVRTGGNDADDIIFNAQGYATDVFRILGNGNIGVGTTSPGKKLDVNGYVRGVGVFNTLNSAPADGDLAPGECALWFDPTSGASKLMIKAKQADGAVKTASVPLS